MLVKNKGIHQVSALYSQHIYKTSHKNFLYSAQLDKFKAMYQNQKRQKRKLIKELKQLEQKKIKMEQQRQIFSFAFDTLSCKFDNDIAQKSKVFLQRLQTSVNKISQDDFNKSMKKTHINSQKIKMINELKKNYDLSQEFISPKDSEHESRRSEIISNYYKKQELQIEIERLQKDIQVLKDNIRQEQMCSMEKQKKIKLLESCNQQKDTIIKEKYSQIKNLNNEIEYLRNKVENLSLKLEESNNRNEENLMKISGLQIQLKITHETYHQRQQKEKQCVKLLQNFSKQLKLNDQKVKQFIKEQFPDYCMQDYSTSKKNYQQHLSYVLHLYKKKQTLYEQVLEQLRKRMRQSDLRAIVIQKKLNNYYQLNKHLQKCLQPTVSPTNQFQNLRKIILDFNK